MLIKYIGQVREVAMKTYLLDTVLNGRGVGVCDRCTISAEEVKVGQLAMLGFDHKLLWGNYDQLTDEPTSSQPVTEGLSRSERSTEARPSVY